MKFKTDLHVHSADVSNCASISAKEIVQNYLEKGYTSLVLTNHMSRFTYKNNRFDHSNYTWEQKVDYFMDGYNKIVNIANGQINILLGMELRSNRDENDYLVYGVTEEFLKANPKMMDETLTSFIDKCHKSGLLFIQAHPFRNTIRITNPEYLDGIEVYNGHTGHDSRNDIANLWADKFSLIKTSGTDYHEECHIIGGGIETDEPITSNTQLLQILKSGNYTLLRNSGVIC